MKDVHLSKLRFNAPSIKYCINVPTNFNQAPVFFLTVLFHKTG
jgi:hypothetical protein